MSQPAAHLSFELLLQDWLGEGDLATREAIDVHLMACDSCGEQLDELVALGDGVRRALGAGLVTAVVGAEFVQRLAQAQVRVREYSLPHNGSVHCTVAPHDQLLVSRLHAPLQGVQRLDIAVEVSVQPGVLHRTEDIPFDPTSGEVLLVSSIALVRQLPAHTMQLTLLAADQEGSREVGRYQFHHTPWAG